MLRKIGLASLGLTVFMGATAGAAGAAPKDKAEPATTGATATVAAEFDCESVTVSSDGHELSNVVLRFADGDQRFEGIDGYELTFSGSGDFEGDEILAVFVKAGSNASDEGHGYGERIDAPSDSCGRTEPSEEPVTTPVDDSTDVDSDDKPGKGPKADEPAPVETVDTIDTPAAVPAVLAANDVQPVAVPAAVALGSPVAASAGRPAEVLGVTFERPAPAPAIAEAPAVAAGALARTGTDLTLLVFTAFLLISTGIVALLRSRRATTTTTTA